MASHDRLLVQFTLIARVIDVGGTLHADTRSLFFVFFRYEALKTQKYVAHHELLHFLKLKKIIQLF